MSFVFGLEVNWDLLQLREEEMKEQVEQRKLQNKKDLEELNERRRQQKLAASGVGDENDDESDEEDEGNKSCTIDLEGQIIEVKNDATKLKEKKRKKTKEDKVQSAFEDVLPREAKSNRKSKKAAVEPKVPNKRKKSVIQKEVIELWDDDEDEVQLDQPDIAATKDSTGFFPHEEGDDDPYIFDNQSDSEVLPPIPTKLSPPVVTLLESPVKSEKIKQSKRRIVVDDSEGDEEVEKSHFADFSDNRDKILDDITNVFPHEKKMKKLQIVEGNEPKKKQKADEAQNKSWVCAACTYINEKGKYQRRPKCTVCG